MDFNHFMMVHKMDVRGFDDFEVFWCFRIEERIWEKLVFLW